MQTAQTQQTAYTPGPWNEYGANVIGSNGVRIAHTFEITHRGSSGVHEEDANGRLIAAAPELLAALRDLVRIMDQNCHLTVERIARGAEAQDARAAIAKAKGE